MFPEVPHSLLKGNIMWLYNTSKGPHPSTSETLQLAQWLIPVPVITHWAKSLLSFHELHTKASYKDWGTNSYTKWEQDDTDTVFKVRTHKDWTVNGKKMRSRWCQVSINGACTQWWVLVVGSKMCQKCSCKFVVGRACQNNNNAKKLESSVS